MDSPAKGRTHIGSRPVKVIRWVGAEGGGRGRAGQLVGGGGGTGGEGRAGAAACRHRAW